MLYYFHVRNGADFERDPDGTELPDLNSAYAEALIVSRELIDAIPEFSRDTIIEIADAAGQILQLVRFSEADKLDGVARD